MGCKLIFTFSKSHFCFKSKQQIASGGGWGERHLELCPRCCFKRSERFVVHRLYCWRQSGEKASAAEAPIAVTCAKRSSLLKKLLLQLKSTFWPKLSKHILLAVNVPHAFVSQNSRKSPAQLSVHRFPLGGERLRSTLQTLTPAPIC